MPADRKPNTRSTRSTRSSTARASRESTASTALVKHEHGYTTHEDFQEGDVTLVCQRTRFVVNSMVVAMCSRKLETLLNDAAEEVVLQDKAEEMAIFLHLVYAGKPEFVNKPLVFTQHQVLPVRALLSAMGATQSIQALFTSHVQRRARSFVAELGPNAGRRAVFKLLELAITLESGSIWDAALRDTANANGWKVVHDPYTITKEEKTRFPVIATSLLAAAQYRGLHGLGPRGISFKLNTGGYFSSGISITNKSTYDSHQLCG